MGMKRSSGTRRRRADAERSIASIVDAATECLGRRPDASMTEVAAAAGVGRATLYAHFRSRAALLEAAFDPDIAADILATTLLTLPAGPGDRGDGSPQAQASPQSQGNQTGTEGG